MQLKWTRANVSLIAESHNPSILSPDWIEHHILGESRENFIHTPIFSHYQSRSFSLVVEQNRFQLSLRVLSEAALPELQGAASKYIGTLPQVPYRAVGLNFSWTAAAERPEEGFNLMAQLFSSGIERIRKVFSGGTVKIGTILYHEAAGYRLQLQVVPQVGTEGNLVLNFNYHFDVHSHDEAREAVSRLVDCFSSADQASRRLLDLA